MHAMCQRNIHMNRTWKAECRYVTHHNIRLSLRHSFNTDQLSWCVNVANLIEEHCAVHKEQMVCVVD